MEPSEKQVPAAWPDDSLSRFFALADYNCRAASLNYPKIYTVIQHVNKLFERVQETLEQDDKQVLLIPRFLFIRARSALLAGFRLAMSGQIPETYPVYRSAIEHAWYALHIAKDPAPPQRGEIWLRRGETEAATKECKIEFKIANVRSTHEEFDPFEASHVRQVYEGTIDLGAHPSQLSLFSAFHQEEGKGQIKYAVGILYPAEYTHLATVGFGTGLAVSILRIFALIYPERFTIMGFHAEVDNLLAETQKTFASLTA